MQNTLAPKVSNVQQIAAKVLLQDTLKGKFPLQSTPNRKLLWNFPARGRVHPSI